MLRPERTKFYDVSRSLLESEDNIPDDVVSQIFDAYKEDMIHSDLDDTIIDSLESELSELLDYHVNEFEENCTTLFKELLSLQTNSDLLKPAFVSLGVVNPLYKNTAEEHLSKTSTSNILDTIDLLEALRSFGHISDSIYESYISKDTRTTLSHMNSLMEILGQGESTKSISTNPSDDIDLVFPESGIIIKDIYISLYKEDDSIWKQTEKSKLYYMLDRFCDETLSVDRANCLVTGAVKLLCHNVASMIRDMVDVSNYPGMADVLKQIKQLNNELSNEFTRTILRWVMIMIYSSDTISMKRIHEILSMEPVESGDIEVGSSYKMSKSRVVISANQIHGHLESIRRKYGMSTSSGYISDMYTNSMTDQTATADYHKMDDNVVDSTLESGTMESLTEMKPSDCVRALTESLTVLPDGKIRVRIKKKTTFMDEYAENHRLLKSNEKLGNYEGMKYNLVYCLILIDTIERKVLYAPGIDPESDAYKDALKAKNFANNDLSVYLPIVKKHERNFDINRFYKEVEADRATIEVDTVAALKGIKKIIQAIVV